MSRPQTARWSRDTRTTPPPLTLGERLAAVALWAVELAWIGAIVACVIVLVQTVGGVS